MATNQVVEKNGTYIPPETLSTAAHVPSMDAYRQQYALSIADPEAFWAEVADSFHWYKKWDVVRAYNYDMDQGPISIRWFEGAKTNIAYNCIDRHLKSRGDQVAIIWEGNEPGEDAQLTYKELHEQVCKFANVLKSRGVKKGDCVSIYMPMIPELAIAMLACARIGAIHSIVFGGFSAEALADRIVDSACRVVLTTDGMFRGDRPMARKQPADEAIALADSRMPDAHVHTCIVVQRVGERPDMPCPMREGRDLWCTTRWQKRVWIARAKRMDAEDPLFILYTSGSTGKPKGVQHNVGGYMVYTGFTHKHVFDYRDGDIYFCAADIGWITGHSYIIYGPLANAATTIMFESTPVYPDPGRYWQVIDKYQGRSILHRAHGHSRPHPRGRILARQIRSVLAQTPRHSGRAHQPGSVAVVPSQYWARAMPHRGYVVANRDRGHPHQPLAGRDPHQTRLGHPALVRHQTPWCSNPNPAKSSRAMAWMACSLFPNPGPGKCGPSMGITSGLRKPIFSSTRAFTLRATVAAGMKTGTIGSPGGSMT